MIHAAADLSFGESLVLDEAALEQGREALLGGAPVYCDARMAAAGITSRKPIVPLDDPRAKTPRPGPDPLARPRCGSPPKEAPPGASG